MRRAERTAETREAILCAAEALFTAEGWQGTRITEVAARAGVATATCYNHFGSKHALIGHLFAPRIEAARARVEALAVGGAEPRAVVRAALGEIVTLLLADRRMTFALFAAVQEDTIRSAGPPAGPGDVRTIANLPVILDAGLARAALDTGIDVPRTSRYHTNGLFIQVLTRPEATAEDLLEFVAAQLEAALAQNSRRSLESIPRSAS